MLIVSMSATTQSSQAAPAPPASPPPTQHVKLLDWLPWEKSLIWGLVILAVYAMRHFFFIIFVTFIVAYIMRSSVRRISRFVLPNRESAWLERSLTVAGFVLLLFGLYGVGNYLGPEIYRQGQALFDRVKTIEPEKELNNLITRTVGTVLFYRNYGGKTDDRYKEKFQEFQKEGPGVAAFKTFPDLVASLESHFELEEAQKIKAKLTEKDKDKEFQAWFIREKSPSIFERDRVELIKKWEKRYEDAAEFAGLPSLSDVKAKADYESHRDPRIKEMIFKDLDKTQNAFAAYRTAWEEYTVKNALTALKSSPSHTERFRELYNRLRKEEAPAFTLPEGKPPYELAKYFELKDAYEHGEAAFAFALRDLVPTSEEYSLTQAQSTFEQTETRHLVDSFLKSPTYGKIRDVASEYVENGLKSLAVWVQQTIGYLFTLPVQLALSLLLSFFITFDIPRLRRGLLGLKQSRVHDFYEEIAPGLYNFGRLIGRAFQAQGVIALFNTLLTFVAFRALQIQNETFLCALVFVCSFIPVLGVVLSSVPISILSIVQPGGSIFLALEAIAAILVIHFIETSVLNPKILGEMLHLHPVMVLAVLAIGEHFFGVWGLLLGVPVTVFIIRCVILNEEIPGLIEADPLARVSPALEPRVSAPAPPASFTVEDGRRDTERKDASQSVSVP
jgi:predicted PurR-regulated permease PerM